MKKVGKQLILISFFLAVLASAAVFAYFHSYNALKTSKSSSKKITVIAAAQAIPAGTKIDKKMITEIQVSDNSIFGDCIKNSSSIIGKYTKESISKNEIFYKNKIYDTNGNEFILEIPKNHRAVSINVTGDSGISYLLKAKDKVDIIVYLPEKKDGEKIVQPEISKSILQNIEVLAVDRLIHTDDKVPDKMPNAFLVTLSIPNIEIEKLFLAEKTGTLKLALRPLNNESDTQTNGTTWKQILSNDSTKSSTSSKNTKNNFKYYTVKKGDNLKSISASFYGDPAKYTLIKDANNIDNENIIIIGEILKIPSKTTE